MNQLGLKIRSRGSTPRRELKLTSEHWGRERGIVGARKVNTVLNTWLSLRNECGSKLKENWAVNWNWNWRYSWYLQYLKKKVGQMSICKLLFTFCSSNFYAFLGGVCVQVTDFSICLYWIELCIMLYVFKLVIVPCICTEQGCVL